MDSLANYQEGALVAHVCRVPGPGPGNWDLPLTVPSWWCTARGQLGQLAKEVALAVAGSQGPGQGQGVEPRKANPASASMAEDRGGQTGGRPQMQMHGRVGGEAEQHYYSRTAASSAIMSATK